MTTADGPAPAPVAAEAGPQEPRVEHRPDRRPDRAPRPDRPRGADSRTDGKPRGERFERGGPRGDRGGDRPQTFEARPPRESARDRIDPDNPFAAALAGFKAK